MNSNTRAYKKTVYEGFRGFVAIAVSLLLLPYGQQGLFAQDPQQQPPPDPQQQQPQYPPQQQPYPQQQQQPPYAQQQQQMPPQGGYMPLGADQLNQLVAPIALYPDSLVAQVLTAATYPQQVMDANSWLGQTNGMPPDQRAATANGMPWDPSVKALTAFPQVLGNMAQNQNWTGALGNAYYNQPGDVMNAVQAMRFRAQQAGHLRPTPHYGVYSNAGLIVIEPVNPGMVYVPYYDPWAIYGPGIRPWGGYYYGGPPRGVVFAAGLGIGFAAGISIGLFSHYGWGYHNWSPNWHGGVVVYNHTTYISRSTTVINRGNFGANNRGVFERPGAGVPNNFHPAVTSQSAAFHSAGRPGEFRGSGYANQRPVSPSTPQGAQGRQFGQPRPSGAPAQFGQARTPQPSAPPAQFGRQNGQTPQVNRPAPTTPRAPQSATPQYQQQRQQQPQARPNAVPQQHSQAPQSHAQQPQHEAAPSHQGGGGGHSAPPAHHTEEKKR